ncbi:undecaprenyl-diphosphate phosphatase [Candidatus Pacearchaeota archaeon]|nr:undecaprenyl-diphosphate phosphatase [Candidatus Pacearchaeota archaeon]
MTNHLIESLLMAVVQGITEWLPVSSSGHLVLTEKLLNFKGGLTLDVALHFGTLMAAFVYFGSDIVNIIRDLLGGKWQNENGHIGLLLIIATIPAAIIGFLFKDFFEFSFSQLTAIALGFGITGLLLLITAITKTSSKKSLTNLTWKDALLIGIAQTIAIFPGISRSGTTIASAILLGLNEKNAVKFSFLMSIPIIFGANILVIGNNKIPANMIWASLVSLFVGLIMIHILLKYILTKKKNLIWFGIYALTLGVIIGVLLILGIL